MTETWLTQNHPEGHDPELYECEITEEVIEEKPVPKCRLTRVSILSGAAKGQRNRKKAGRCSACRRSRAKERRSTSRVGALAHGASKREVKEWSTGAPVNLYRYQPQTAAAPARTAYVASVSTYSRPKVSGAEPPCGISEASDRAPN